MNGKTTEINGWKLYTHPCFDSQLEALVAQVEELKQKNPDNYQKKAATKLLAAILKVIKMEICGNPMDARFRQGETLGEENKHWFRAKFLGQYRLFFRFSEQHRTIILAWVNDESTRRAYDHKRDAYKVFSAMIFNGNPPSDWDRLLSESSTEKLVIE